MEIAREGYAICTECGIEKHQTAFYADGKTLLGKKRHRPECKVCYSKARDAKKKTDIEKGKF